MSSVSHARILAERIVLDIFVLAMIGLTLFLKIEGWTRAWPYMMKSEHIADHWAWFYVIVAWIPLFLLQSLQPEMNTPWAYATGYQSPSNSDDAVCPVSSFPCRSI